jgi:hypothetical protein
MQDLTQIGQEFATDNVRVNNWFNNHSTKLKSFIIAELPNMNLDIKIMGSMRWGTNHSLSDIDAVIVTASTNLESIITILSNYYILNYASVKQFKTITKAGLYLFVMKDFADPELGKMKLEYTIQSPEINNKIITEMKVKLENRFANVNERTMYALEMMKAVKEENMEKQLSLKEWTRIL